MVPCLCPRCWLPQPGRVAGAVTGRRARRYAVACFLLQAKDRHNGNILLDGRGRLVHIDFGFILEISPGGNMRFESAAFKLSHEMAQLLDPGGGRASAPFRRFQELCIRGFLAARGPAPFASQPETNLRLQLHS